MPRTKAKPSKRIEEEEEDLPEVVEPLPLDPVKKVVAPTDFILDMDGVGAEVASALIVNGLLAYLSVTNKGINLVAANRANTAFLPVKITSRAGGAGLDLKREEAERTPGAVLAFLVGEDDDRMRWYLTAADFLAKAEERAENVLSVNIDDHWDWLEQFEGHAGIKKVFTKLMK